MLHTFSAVYLAFILALCTTVSRHPSTATELVPVRESHPNSTMHIWRPYTVYFVGDRHFDPLQRVVPRSGNITQFDLYAQSYLNMVSYNFREMFHGCEVKIKVIGTRVFTVQEEELYLPKVVKDGQIYVDLRNLTFEEFFALNPEVESADIVVFITGHTLLSRNYDYALTVYSPDESRICTRDKYIVLTDQAFSYSAWDDLTEMLRRKMGVADLYTSGNVCLRFRNAYRQSLTGNAVSNGEPVLCYNTINTCCLPDFYGIYNLRREPLCKRYNSWETANRDTYRIDDEPVCWTTCQDEQGHIVPAPAHEGKVKSAMPEHWGNTYAGVPDVDVGYICRFMCANQRSRAGRSARVGQANTDTELSDVDASYRCHTSCMHPVGKLVHPSPAPVGTVKSATSEYWTRSLLCPSDDDEICNPDGFHHHRTYKHFKKAIINAWELDDYEVPETDVTFCMQ
ncbi:uncharacterized protein LOC135369307 [Ornithodoros turicata]|uniref:uncharacterized protein LOC135369307 n=1 Tax=Ornithodoros turicata TaxID=34597 RepID=UPI003138CC9B